MKKGRLSKEDIERMVREAEKFSKHDEEQRERIQSRNQLEGLAYSLKNTEGVQDSVKKSAEDTLVWIDSNSQATKQEYDTKFNELQKLASSNNPEPNNNSVPDIQEVD